MFLEPVRGDSSGSSPTHHKKAEIFKKTTIYPLNCRQLAPYTATNKQILAARYNMSAQKEDNTETLDNEIIDEKTEEQAAGDVTQEARKEEGQLESPEKNADSLEAQLEDAQAKASENWEHYLRAKAEMDNLRRRNTKDVENAHKYGIEKFVTELLPVLDSMVMGLATEGASAESLREGMELTLNMLAKMMEKLGIEEIDPINEKFDPEKHQAMTMQPNAEVEPNTVIAVMQKGYSLNDRLIRPAMVMVSKAVEEES
jgi:molecular chaperone GrpE